jgi:sporulation protein YlmC with PRC-barrel domain
MMFRIGSPVFATDGKVGVLQYVVLNPETQEISDLIVKCDLVGDARVLSARHIDFVDEDGAVHLSVDKTFVRRSRTFDRAEFVESSEEPVAAAHSDGRLYWQDIYGVTVTELPKSATHVHIVTGVDDDDVLVGKGSRVFTALGEHVGTVDHVVIDPDARKLLYLVVRLPGIRRRRVVVAASQVKEWQPDVVVLDLDKDALYALPPYVPAKRDETLARLVRQAIAALGVEVEHLSVFVDKGHVLLRGHSQSLDDRRRAEAAARSVSGVLSVANEITTDKHLDVLVQQRLLDDPVASRYPVDVIVKNRIATVIGKVPSPAVQDVILEIVRNTPGIVSVIDDLSVDAAAFVREWPGHLLDDLESPVVPATQEP